MATKKKSEPTKPSARKVMAKNRKDAQFVNNLVKRVQKQYPGRLTDQLADARNVITETTYGNRKEDARLLNRARGKIKKPTTSAKGK
jgi:hypothetical protein